MTHFSLPISFSEIDIAAKHCVPIFDRTAAAITLLITVAYFLIEWMFNSKGIEPRLFYTFELLFPLWLSGRALRGGSAASPSIADKEQQHWLAFWVIWGISFILLDGYVTSGSWKVRFGLLVTVAYYFLQYKCPHKLLLYLTETASGLSSYLTGQHKGTGTASSSAMANGETAANVKHEVQLAKSAE